MVWLINSVLLLGVLVWSVLDTNSLLGQREGAADGLKSARDAWARGDGDEALRVLSRAWYDSPTGLYDADGARTAADMVDLLEDVLIARDQDPQRITFRVRRDLARAVKNGGGSVDELELLRVRELLRRVAA